MLQLAQRNLFQSKARLLISVGGVGLALMLMLALDAIFSGSEQQLTAYIDNAGADVFVAQSGVYNLHMSASWLPASVVTQVQAVAGVQAVSPIMYLTEMIEVRGERNAAYIIGLPPNATLGKPWRIATGVALPPKGGTVIDQGLAKKYGLNLGDTVKVLGLELKIVGLSEGTSSITNSIAFIAMSDFAQARSVLASTTSGAGMTGMSGSGSGGAAKLVSFVLVQVVPGQSPAAVASRIEAQVSGVTAQSKTAFAAGESKLVRDMAGDVLAIMNTIGFAVGLAVLALTVYIATFARRAEYGALKALGAGNGYLYGVVLTQALISVAMGLGLGLGFTLLLAFLLPLFSSNMALVVSGQSLLTTTLTALVIAILAAILPVIQIAGLDPATVIRRRVQ